MSRRTVVQFAAVITLLTKLQERVPDLFQELHNRMGDYDGFPHDLSASDMPRPKGPPSSVVENQATGQLLELAKVERATVGHITDIAYATYELLRLANQWAPQTLPEAAVCAS